MIADEVGLGKTIEAAMVYEELKLRRQAKRCLVIALAGLTAGGRTSSPRSSASSSWNMTAPRSLR